MAEMVGPRLYSCCNCRNHVALHDDVISKAFQGRNGRAFLFSHAMNVSMGPKEDRHLMTGLHTVADVFCSDCREVLGWKYERAYEESQKYKEGKFILEKSKIVKENWSNNRDVLSQTPRASASSSSGLTFELSFNFASKSFSGPNNPTSEAISTNNYKATDPNNVEDKRSYEGKKNEWKP
ncbi:Yippee-like protein [Cynara cardunculus var. scolymus]|uniref:Yippee-like protein n=3 Tax=Cardueae TaxID=102818 RepID=A0A118JTJ8_CYNCS|nr:Yippee-like protein [Cynara cardunculus var. scolymus]